MSLYQGLVQVRGECNVFLDVGRDQMDAGRPWKETVRETLLTCDTVLLVFDPGMPARLQNPQDAVRFEVETARANGARIVCLRVNGASVADLAEVPASLGDFSSAHSPEIHPDVAVADIERVIQELTGRVPGQTASVDRWDLSLLLILAVLGLAAWFSVGGRLNLEEAWLWGASLVIPWLLWMFARRLFSVSPRGRLTEKYRQTAGWALALLTFTVLWIIGYKSVYPLPGLTGGSGILVARLEGDPANRAQSELVERLERDLLQTPEDASDAVAALPVRIGFSVFRSATDNGHDVAREYARRCEAAVVLWGESRGAADPIRQLSINLTFIDAVTLFKTKGSEVVGALGTTEVEGVASSLELLARILPRLLDGYRIYYAAEGERDLRAADRQFQAALADLSEVHADGPGRRALDEIQASIHFYRGNTLVALSKLLDDGKASLDEEAYLQDAVSEYELALAVTTNVQGSVESPQYVAAANNYGWLLTQQCEHGGALEILEEADSVCRTRESMGRACAYAWYNLGDVLSAHGKHEDAAKVFAKAAQIDRANHATLADRRLAAHALQYRAYSLVRLAAASPPESKAGWLIQADESWTRGVETLRRHGFELPEFFNMTRGRILIERQQWEAATELLMPLSVPPCHVASKEALLAAAFACTDMSRSAEHLGRLLKMSSGRVSNDSKALNCGDCTHNVQGHLDEISRIKRLCSEVSDENAH